MLSVEDNLKSVIVVGAGPAGLAAAWELINSGIQVTVIERDPTYVGGLAKTMRYNDYRFDIGAHRFFSRNPEVTRWWRERLPNDFVRIKRLTRILYNGKFFEYPLKPLDAFRSLGFLNTVGCLSSYVRRQIRPIRPEKSFQDWVINRFGDRLFTIFFKTYTEKVWGMECSRISSDWASQRIQDLSLAKAMVNAFRKKTDGRISKTLIDSFEYPRLGAGMLWEKTREEIERRGARIFLGRQVTQLFCNFGKIEEMESINANGAVERWRADAFITSMPLKDLALAIRPKLDDQVLAAAEALKYRDFIIVVLIIDQKNVFPDNWIYVHDPGVRVGRIENFNNWSIEMNPRQDTTCLELEYFCSRQDELWHWPDEKLIELAKREIEQLGISTAQLVRDACAVRIENAYPVYDAHYKERITEIRSALSQINNLQVAGRNGMHKYNNQDHSIVTGMLAARNLKGEKQDVWRVNTDAQYHENETSEDCDRIVPTSF